MNWDIPSGMLWESFSQTELVAYLSSTFYRDPLINIKMIGSVLDKVKQMTFRESFPKCKHPDGNVIIVDSCSFCPVTGEMIKDDVFHYAMNYLNPIVEKWVPYSSSFDGSAWLHFLNQAFGNDVDCDDKIKLLQEFMGLSLTDITKFGKMLLLVGEGVDGRNVVLNTLQMVMGDGNLSTIPLSDFNCSRALANLQHKLVNVDATADRLANIIEFQAVANGESVVLEHEVGNPFNWNLTTKLWASIDKLPEISEQFAQHIIPIQFNHKFTDAEQDSNLEINLLTEQRAIIEWAVEGLHRLLANNAFTVPLSSTVVEMA
jgi:phage/plasmid-associated DNA primase